MLDVAAAYTRYKFLGYEFLTWLWFLTEKDRNFFQKIDPDTKSLDIGNRLVLENRGYEAVETVTIKGDDAGLEEGMMSLRKGAVVTEINLIYTSGDQEWRFSLKGESFDIANLKHPETEPLESKDDVEGVILEKIWLYDKVVQFIDKLFICFIKLRVSKEWDQNTLPRIKSWIYE